MLHAGPFETAYAKAQQQNNDDGSERLAMCAA